MVHSSEFDTGNPQSSGQKVDNEDFDHDMLSMEYVVDLVLNEPEEGDTNITGSRDENAEFDSENVEGIVPYTFYVF